jgi:hypothetical protein
MRIEGVVLAVALDDGADALLAIIDDDRALGLDKTRKALVLSRRSPRNIGFAIRPARRAIGRGAFAFRIRWSCGWDFLDSPLTRHGRFTPQLGEKHRAINLEGWTLTPLI